MKEKEKKQKQKQIKKWKVSDEFKTGVIKILETYPFSQVSTFIKLVNALDEVDETTLNSVLNELAKLPYKDVSFYILNVSKLCTPLDVTTDVKVED